MEHKASQQHWITQRAALGDWGCASQNQNLLVQTQGLKAARGGQPLVTSAGAEGRECSSHKDLGCGFRQVGWTPVEIQGRHTQYVLFKSLLSLLQYCFCFIIWFFDQEACGTLAPRPGIELTSPALESEVPTPGPPGKSQTYSLDKSLFSRSTAWLDRQGNENAKWKEAVRSPKFYWQQEKSWQNDLAAFQWKDDPKSRASSQQTWNRSQVLKSRQGTCNMGPADSRITVDQRFHCASSVRPFELLSCHCMLCVCGWVTGVFTFTDQVRGTPQTSSPTPAPQRIWARGFLLAWWLGSAWAQAWLMALGSSPSFPP